MYLTVGLPNYIGSPPSCRPECLSSSECTLDKACINQRCVDPCLTTQCGARASCRVINHSPICACDLGYTGDPFRFCQEPPRIEPPKPNPCIPSPCGPFSECSVQLDAAVCNCLKDYIGNPPYCRAECVIDADCLTTQACVGQKCQDACREGRCGVAAECRAINHRGTCFCLEGYTGDPYSYCNTPPGKGGKNIKKT